jgi:hypothetical protein
MASKPSAVIELGESLKGLKVACKRQVERSA